MRLGRSQKQRLSLFEFMLDSWERFYASIRAFRRRKLVESQKRPTDCGYICISAALTLFGCRLTVSEIKARCGDTSRGLTLRQLRDALEKCGAVAKAVQFDRRRSEAYPCPGIILLERGHYILIAAKGRNWLDAYYPEFGWLRLPTKRVAREANGLGVMIESVAKDAKQSGGGGDLTLLLLFLKKARSRLGLGVFFQSLISQFLILLLPLLTKQSVDGLQIGAHAGYVGTVAIGFVLISGLGALTSFLSNYFSLVLSNRVWRLVSSEVYRRLATKPSSWFEAHNSTNVLNILKSVDTQLQQFGDLIGAAGSFIVTFSVGMIVLFVISPWLSLPGFLSAVISIALGWFFGVMYRTVQFVSLEAQQRRQSFIVDVMTQVPVIARVGGLKRAGTRYDQIIRRVTDSNLRMSMVKARRGAATSIVKLVETFAFVSVVAYFMKRGHYSLGAFVAVGAYKDTLVQAVSILFQRVQQYQNLDYHRAMTRGLWTETPSAIGNGRSLAIGKVEFNNVTFGYGELEPPVFSDASFSANPSDVVVIAGPSGTGKSTIAKLICGVLQPTLGEVLVDGAPPVLPIRGLGSVLQSDRLISGTIRENVCLFRNHVSDEEIYAALELCALKEFVLSLPMGLNTPVSESMPGLSGGQRQRVLLARAAINRPKLFVLDEATSNIEVAGEATIIQNLVATGATLILISHRPEVWRYATRFYNVSNGQLVEQEFPHACSHPDARREALESRYEIDLSVKEKMLVWNG